MRIRIHPYIIALGLATVSVAGMFTPGQLGGLIAGGFGMAAWLAMCDWRIADFGGALRGLRWRLFRDPRLAGWPRLQGLLAAKRP